MKKIIIRSLIAIVLLAAVAFLILKFVHPEHELSQEAKDRFELNSNKAKNF